MKTKLLQIDNRVGKVKLNDSVNPWSVDELLHDIERSYGNEAVQAQMIVAGEPAKAEDSLTELHLEIHSPGGSVLDGYRVYNELMAARARGVRVVATINTLAASMASVIVMAANEIRMVTGARMMIHEASTVTAGDSERHRAAAELLDSMSGEIAAIYAKRTGGDAEDIRATMKKEKWMSAAEAVAAGYADKVVDLTYDATAKFDTPLNSMTGILAKLFPGNDEVSKVEAAILEVETLRADLQSAQARIDELAPLAEANATLQSELSTATAQIETITNEKAELDAKVIELTEAATVTDEKIKIRAQEMLAATGHPQPVATTPAESKSILDKFNELTGPEASEFYRKHGKEIRAASMKK
jgi:ATP-dependent protease ClpP protease subunit